MQLPGALLSRPPSTPRLRRMAPPTEMLLGTPTVTRAAAVAAIAMVAPRLATTASRCRTMTDVARPAVTPRVGAGAVVRAATHVVKERATFIAAVVAEGAPDLAPLTDTTAPAMTAIAATDVTDVTETTGVVARIMVVTAMTPGISDPTNLPL
jgi:hypothetical protein